MNVGHRLIIRCTIILLLLAVVAAVPLHAENAAARKKWTFMLYMAADNNLESSADADLNELETIGSTENVNIVVQLDRIGRYSQDSEFKWPEAKRFFVKKDSNPKKFSSPVIQELGEIDMAAPESLLDFITWAARNYPAERYALIMWNHGTGWKEISPQIMASYDTIETDRRRNVPDSISAALNSISYNISYDDTSASSMDIPSLGATMAKVPGILGQPLDLLGFDACLMQMLEVAYEVRDYARYQVGAPDLEPDRGWPYDAILQKLAATPTMDGRKLGQSIVASYKASYEAGSQGNTSVVLSLIDLSKVKEFTTALEGLARTLKEGMQEIDAIDQAREEALKYVYKDYADLGHFIQLLSAKMKGSGVKSALGDLKSLLQGTAEERLVVSCARTGEKYKNSYGLAVFLPDREGFHTYKNRYKLLAMSKENGWFKFLQEYEAPSFPYIRIQDILLEDENRDGRFAPGELVTVGLQLRNLGTKPAVKARITLNSASEFIEQTSFALDLTELPAPRKEKIVSVFKFRIKPDAPLNQPVALSASLSGQQIPLSTAHTTFYLKSPFVSAGKVLLVYTDGFSPAAPVLQAMLRDSGVAFDVWDRSLDGNLRPDVLKRYMDGWVLLSVQDSSDQQKLANEEVESLSGFLKTGGRLVISGQDLPFSLRETPFLETLCKVKFVQDDTNVHVVKGLGGFLNGSTYQIYGGDGANNQKWPDEIDALPGASVIMKYEEGARDLANDSDMNGPNLRPSSPTRGIKSSGGAAVKVVDGYRLLFFAFGIEAVNSQVQRAAMVKAIASFMSPEISGQIQDMAGASRSRSRARSRTARDVALSAEMMGNLQERILKQVKQNLEQNPQLPARALETIRALPPESRSAVSSLERDLQGMVNFTRTQEQMPRR